MGFKRIAGRLGDAVRALPTYGLAGYVEYLTSIAAGRGWVTAGDTSRPVRVRQLNGTVFLRRGTSDWHVADEILLRGEYQCVADRRLSDVRCVVDLGANVGLSVRYWQRLFPDAHIIAVEPETRNFETLRQNVAAGPHPSRVKTFRCCVGGESRTAELDTGQQTWSYRLAGGSAGVTQAVDVLSLPDLLARAGWDGPIDLLKCDIEGAERELFATARDWLPAVRHLIVELHGDYHLDAFRAALVSAGGDFTFDVTSKHGQNETVVFCTNRKST